MKKKFLLFSIIITLLVGAGIFVWWQDQSKEVEASPDPDWLSGWDYRRAITINNTSGGALNDYQVSVTVDAASLISAGKMQDDLHDFPCPSPVVKI